MKFNSIVLTLLNLSAVYSATASTTTASAAGGSTINLSNIGDVSGGLRADSDLGMKLLSKARRLEDNGAAEEEEEEYGYDITWVTGFSLKFLGCHYVQQYKEDGDQDQQQEQQGVDVQRLVHFRLCPNDLCRGNSDTGCTKKYGDYVVGLNTFINVYYENQQRLDEYNCEMYAQNTCNCQDNGDDGYDEEKCEYDCFAAAGMEEICADGNPYEEEGEEAYEFEVDRYMECAELEMNQGGRRRMEEDGGTGLFIGPYCTEQGGEIHLGVFTDEGCSQFADKYQGTKTFTSLTGMELPYASQNIVKADTCLSCIDLDQEDNNQKQVSEMCEQVYLASGKCEKNLPSGAKDEPSNFACDYIDGVQTILNDGIARSKQRSNGASTFFLIVLSLSTISLALYVRYLRTRLGLTARSQAKNASLLVEEEPREQQQPPARSQYSID